MQDFDSPAPSIATLRRALGRTTETLARELASPTERPPEWSDLEWRVARASAALHGISPLLSRALRWRGPASWRRFLEEQRVHTATRYRRIAALLGQIGSRARVDGIAFAALKGAALHAIGLYRGGERPMADLDLLVRERDVEPMARLLAELGYRLSLVTPKNRVYVPSDAPTPAELGEHTDNAITVEIHTSIIEFLPLAKVDISDQTFPLHLHPGLNSYPSAGALMGHLLLHAAGDMANRRLRFVQLHDIALLAPRLAATDWADVARPQPGGQARWWSLPPLRLAALYFPAAIPPEAIAAAARDCSVVLSHVSRRQWLSDVSGSKLFVEAFPGIEWAQSVPEALRYIGARLRPSAELLAARQANIRTQPWAAHLPWAHLSQGRRVLRWLLARQPRPDAFYTVTAALRYDRQC